MLLEPPSRSRAAGLFAWGLDMRLELTARVEILNESFCGAPDIGRSPLSGAY
jgi:hypothetical protein